MYYCELRVILFINIVYNLIKLLKTSKLLNQTFK